jgi:hypothetical protein
MRYLGCQAAKTERAARVPPNTRRQIAAEYQISSDTLRRRLRQMKIAIPNGLILPAHQRQGVRAVRC